MGIVFGVLRLACVILFTLSVPLMVRARFRNPEPHSGNQRPRAATHQGPVWVPLRSAASGGFWEHAVQTFW
jgi:hypothetical protein